MMEDVGYRYEKYAVIVVARWLSQRGYEVSISVPGPLEDIKTRPRLGGLDTPRFTEDDLSDPQHRYRVYYDRPGTIDLVARKDSEIWVMEAKGITKRISPPGVVAQAVGQIVLLMKRSEPTFRYALILPEHERFVEVLRTAAPDNPIFARSDFRFYFVSKEGEVACKTWAQVLNS